MSRSRYLPAIVVLLALTVPGAASAGSQIYIALGDSNTFGNDESMPSSTMRNAAEFLRHLHLYGSGILAKRGGDCGGESDSPGDRDGF